MISTYNSNSKQRGIILVDTKEMDKLKTHKSSESMENKVALTLRTSSAFKMKLYIKTNEDNNFNKNKKISNFVYKSVNHNSTRSGSKLKFNLIEFQKTIDKFKNKNC